MQLFNNKPSPQSKTFSYEIGEIYTPEYETNSEVLNNSIIFHYSDNNETIVLTGGLVNKILSDILYVWNSSNCSDTKYVIDPGQHVTALYELSKKQLTDEDRKFVHDLIIKEADCLLTFQDQGAWYISQNNETILTEKIYTNSMNYSIIKYNNTKYSIHAATGGLALLHAFAFTNDTKYLHHAFETFDYYKRDLERRNYTDNLLFWTTNPNDTYHYGRIGTAIDYELWNAYFFSELQKYADENETKQLAQYIFDSINFSIYHINSDGSVISSSEVPELKTAYMSWDAFLLIKIGNNMNTHAYDSYALKILHYLNSTMLLSGAMPYISDYKSDEGSLILHHAGIGPYPILNIYQMYYVVANHEAQFDTESQNKALGFWMREFYDSQSHSIIYGYDGAGKKSMPQSITQNNITPLAHLGSYEYWIVFGLASIDSIQITYNLSYATDNSLKPNNLQYTDIALLPIPLELHRIDKK